MSNEKNNQASYQTAMIGCRSIPEILEKIEIYKSEQKRYEILCKDYPNDLDIKRELYRYDAKISALEWVLVIKNYR